MITKQDHQLLLLNFFSFLSFSISPYQGYNASVIAYGQTGTGKTHTMEGYSDNEGRGLIPRAIEEIYDCIPTLICLYILLLDQM